MLLHKKLNSSTDLFVPKYKSFFLEYIYIYRTYFFIFRKAISYFRRLLFVCLIYSRDRSWAPSKPKEVTNTWLVMHFLLSSLPQTFLSLIILRGLPFLLPLPLHLRLPSSIRQPFGVGRCVRARYAHWIRASGRSIDLVREMSRETKINRSWNRPRPLSRVFRFWRPLRRGVIDSDNTEGSTDAR